VHDGLALDDADHLAGALGERRVLLCAGAGVDHITARELALKIAEGARLPTMALELETVLHGQLAGHEPADALLLVAEERIARRAQHAGRAAAAIGLPVGALLSPAQSGSLAAQLTPAARLITPRSAGVLDPTLGALLAGAIAAQTLTLALARVRETNPDLIRREHRPYRHRRGRRRLVTRRRRGLRTDAHRRPRSLAASRSATPADAPPRRNRMSTIDFTAFDALTFDCYGTLIDWETGILSALRPVLRAHGVERGGDELLEAFGRHEARLEAGPYLTYREVLAGSLRGMGEDLGFTPSADELAAFGRSVSEWPAFDDSVEALRRLKSRFRLGVITNCDDDLFADSNERLGVEFDWVVTAQQARSYKPRLRGFELAFERIDVPRERILHVAQSLFHDHVPAKGIGMTTVWIDRRQGREGSGATPPAEAEPDLTLPDMRSFAQLATGSA
jgi:2-haloacid dehalogenase